MAPELLLKILEREGNSFYPGRFEWKPKGILQDTFRKNLLKQAQSSLRELEAAEAEFHMLDRTVLYLNLLKRLRYSLRQAQFSWRSDDLKFLRAISEFFSDYGTILKYLKIDQARGRFDQPGVGV